MTYALPYRAAALASLAGTVALLAATGHLDEALAMARSSWGRLP